MAFAWRGTGHERFLVVVNYSANQSQCRIRLSFRDLGDESWCLEDQLSSASYIRDGNELKSAGLYVDHATARAHVAAAATDNPTIAKRR